MRRRKHAGPPTPDPPDPPTEPERATPPEELDDEEEDDDELEQPATSPRPSERRGRTSPNRDPLQLARDRHLALGLIASGAPRAVVVATLQERYGLTVNQALHTWQQVADEKLADYEEQRPVMKALQVDRLLRDVARARAASGAKGRQVSLRAIAQVELLIARITGTLEPVRSEVSVDLQVRDAFASVLGSLTREEAEAMVEEQLELERRAGSRTIPELPPTGTEE